MQHLSFVVRWSDADGKNHSKRYPNEPEARKAKAWLLERGATSVDIAVSMGGREFRNNGGGAIPDGAEPDRQQSLIS